MDKAMLMEVLATFLEPFEDDFTHAILIIHQGEKTGMMLWPPDHDNCALILLHDAIESFQSVKPVLKTVSHIKH